MKRYHVLVVLTFLWCALHTAAVSAYKPRRDGPWSREEYDARKEAKHKALREANRDRAGSPVAHWAAQETARMEAERLAWKHGGMAAFLELRAQRAAAAKDTTERQDSTLQEALPGLAGGTGTPVDRELRNGLRNERKAGSYASSSISTHSIPPASVPALVEALQSQDERVRHNAAYQLRFAGALAKEAVPSLLKALNDSDSDVRWVAVGTLGVVGSGSSEVVRALANALRDPVPQVRGAATEALAKIHHRPPPVDVMRNPVAKEYLKGISLSRADREDEVRTWGDGLKYFKEHPKGISKRKYLELYLGGK